MLKMMEKKTSCDQSERHADFVNEQIAKWPEWKKEVAIRVLAPEKKNSFNR